MIVSKLGGVQGVVGSGIYEVMEIFGGGAVGVLKWFGV